MNHAISNCDWRNLKKSSVTSIILLLRSLQKKKTMRRAYSYSRLGTYFFNHRKIIYFIVTSFHLTITFSICKIFISWAIFFFFIVDAFYTNRYTEAETSSEERFVFV